MIDFLTAPLGQDAPNTVNAVIEVARNRATKYNRYARIFNPVEPLNPPVRFPGNYGFIPQTRCANGEPLGVLILGDESPDPACIRPVRPIGVLEIVDDGVPLERVLACAALSPALREVHNYTDAPVDIIREIEHVLSLHRDYRRKYAQVVGWKDSGVARESIRASHARFISRKGSNRDILDVVKDSTFKFP